MNFDIAARTIFHVIHGSHAYGTAIATSDIDTRGICIDPKETLFGYLGSFEQQVSSVSNGQEEDKVIFSIRKFFKLASDCNPNVIEILHVADEHVIKIDEFGEQLRQSKNAFLSKKAKFTFGGYARSQLSRIETHRKWLLDPPKCKPERRTFGLNETSQISSSELGAFDSLLDQKVIDHSHIDSSKIDDLIDQAHEKLEISLPKDLITIFTREKAYRSALTHYNQYLNWKKTRNASRAELEEKFGFDTKHAAHLIRLMLMAKEILQGKGVIVKRPDRDVLLSIRAGNWTYDQVIAIANSLEKECDEIYNVSTLPREPDRVFLNNLCISIVEGFLRKHG